MQISLNGRSARFRHQRGVALILVAMIVIFLGVFASLGLGFLQIKETPDYERDTTVAQQRVVNQLSSFVQLNDRLPCPADPSVARTSANFGREDHTPPGGACNRQEGIVPFRALGIQERDALDGWGRFMTYRVSPVFADNHVSLIPDSGIDVYRDCLARGIWITERSHSRTRIGGGAKITNVNINHNPRKAKFCCPNNGNFGFAATGTDIRMHTAGSASLIQARAGFDDRTSGVNDFGDIDAFQTPPVGSNATAWAFVLVSHGQNGLGTLLANETTDRVPGVAGDELENADEDRDFIERARNKVPGAGYYDDLVVSMTQNGLYGHLNNGSCIRPFR
ncbi:MAG: hypothetical protein HYU57_07865 [Micavibrio aeruginosavorus]|nr:hypothetical protein [Micavibrio aeruginosavorus]